MAYYIGIDIGSSSVKGAVINDSGEIIKTTSCRVDTFYPYPGYSEQNPYNWWDAFKKVVRLLIIGIPGKISSRLSSKNWNASVSMEMITSKCLPLYFFRYNSFKSDRRVAFGSILFVSMNSTLIIVEGI